LAERDGDGDSYLTELDLKVASGELDKPKIWDPVFETPAERGALHEQGFIGHLKAADLAVTAIDGVGIDPKSVAATRDAMARGDPVIVQGALQAGKWNGRADVLHRVRRGEPNRAVAAEMGCPCRTLVGRTKM
jgi:hypothetical protein